MTIQWVIISTPLGPLAMGATPLGLCFLQFGDAPDSLETMLKAEFPRAKLEPSPKASQGLFAQGEAALLRYFEGRAPLPTLPLDLQGTDFQIAVWKFLQTIPSGETMTYTQVAIGVGRAKAVRAVAAACAHNRIALAVPCHRVIRGDGSLAGYRWGLDRKRSLLEFEHRSSGKDGA